MPYAVISNSAPERDDGLGDSLSLLTCSQKKDLDCLNACDQIIHVDGYQKYILVNQFTTCK